MLTSNCDCDTVDWYDEGGPLRFLRAALTCEGYWEWVVMAQWGGDETGVDGNGGDGFDVEDCK